MSIEKSNSHSELFKSKKEEEQFDELFTYVVQHEVSSDDLRDAYFSVCGVYEGGELSDNAKSILEKMNVLVDNGFPLNRFAILVQSQEEYEKSNGGFTKFIDELDISDQEKELLNSIIIKKRSGRLTIGVAGNEPLIGLNVTIPHTMTSAQAGFLLKDVLQKNIEMHLKDKTIEFSFEER